MLNMETPERKPASSKANRPRVIDNAITILEEEEERDKRGESPAGRGQKSHPPLVGIITLTHSRNPGHPPRP